MRGHLVAVRFGEGRPEWADRGVPGLAGPLTILIGYSTGRHKWAGGDFFAAAGDGTWWHDHRFPGGVAFTANATGHMKAFMDWYSDPTRDHGAWAVTQAMMTIARSHATKPLQAGNRSEKAAKEEGRVTWLLDLNAEGKPVVERLPCPLDKVPGQLAGKDWTKYEGLIHTDNAVREEFFDGRAEPLTSHKPPLMDFTYLYDATRAFHDAPPAYSRARSRRGRKVSCGPGQAGIG